MKKLLIINADDFGVCKETNLAIAELYKDGLITSTSLIASGAAFDDAVTLAKTHDIKVGVHFAFNSDYAHQLWRAITDKKLIHSLVDENGFFHKDIKNFNTAAKGKQLTLEMQSQYDIIVENGIDVDHADSHCGTLYGINGRMFFINAFRFCKKHKLPFRFPKRIGFLQDYFGGKVPIIVKLAHKVVLGIAKMYGVKLIDDMISNPHKMQDIDDYKALEEYYLREIRKLKPGINELFLHPSYDAPHLKSDQWQKRVYELDFLRSKNFASALEENSIELCSYDVLR